MSGKRARKRIIQSEEIPDWVKDNLVLRLLDLKGLKIEIIYDQKYLEGIVDKPLIIIRGK